MAYANGTEDPTDPRQLLPNAVYATIVADLYAYLPPPTLNDPELIAERIHAAFAEIACMCCVNAEEAQIAARIVIADAQARECIREARTIFNSPAEAMKCHARANSYMRTANAARAMLLRVQATRRKREAVAADGAQDAWTIRATEGLLLAANGERIPDPPSTSAPQPATPEPGEFARYDAAEQYAALYPHRAAEIRAYGGIPPTARYGPPEPELVAAIIASTSSMLRQVDQEFAKPAAA